MRKEFLRLICEQTKTTKACSVYEQKYYQSDKAMAKVLQNDIELKTKQIEQLKGEKESDLQMLKNRNNFDGITGYTGRRKRKPSSSRNPVQSARQGQM